MFSKDCPLIIQGPAMRNPGHSLSRRSVPLFVKPPSFPDLHCALGKGNDAKQPQRTVLPRLGVNGPSLFAAVSFARYSRPSAISNVRHCKISKFLSHQLVHQIKPASQRGGEVPSDTSRSVSPPRWVLGLPAEKQLSIPPERSASQREALPALFHSFELRIFQKPIRVSKILS